MSCQMKGYTEQGLGGSGGGLSSHGVEVHHPSCRTDMFTNQEAHLGARV